MGLETQRAGIAGRLETGWTTTDIEWPQIEYTPVPGTAYITLHIIPGFGEQVAMPATFRYVDFFQIDINVPKNTGTKTISQYADTLITLFMGQQFDGITVRGVDMNDREVGVWFRRSIRFECYRDESG